MPPSEFLALVLDDSTNDFATYRTAFFTDVHSSKLWSLLELIWNHEKGCSHMKEWMKPHAVDLVCDIIDDEMDSARPKLSMTTQEITPEFISQWDINGLMDQINSDTTPVWTRVLEAASETKEDKAKPKTSKSRNRHTVTSYIHYLRSYHSCKVQIGLGLMAWSTGASRQLINILNQGCLSMSYTSIFLIIQALTKRALEDARVIGAGLHGLQYDNYNQSTSIHPEQGPNAPNKVQSGTVGVLFEVLGANSEHMKISPIMERFLKAGPLKMTDLRPSRQSMECYQLQTKVNIIRILFKYVSRFLHLHKHPDLQHQPRCPLPPHHKTRFFPLRVSTIEEASVKGNILVHDGIYLVQLKRTIDDLNDLAIPAIHDQLTNARNHGAQVLRQKDVTAWTHREIFQLGFSVFHLIMNLIWALLHTYRGTITQLGSLSHLFAVLEKVQLNADRPDFHTLLSALTQILDGLVINAWRDVSGFPSLQAFADSNPMPSTLLNLAHVIIQKYAMPTAKFKPATKSPKSSSLNANDDANRDSEAEDQSIPSKETLTPSKSLFEDTVRENVVRLMHDLLYVIELVKAVSDGDFRRVEDILPDLACIFHAAGSNNYSTEILHFLFNLKEVWTPEFACVNLITTLTSTNDWSEISCTTTCLSMFRAYQGTLWVWI
ncbi:hypothetical protein L208DRAFT_1229582 [Tricholoma matsutake]|nr:hypothetical protein L208DRAFT_1229582 [Tricholoma matsutake 945]